MMIKMTMIMMMTMLTIRGGRVQCGGCHDNDDDHDDDDDAGDMIMIMMKTMVLMIMGGRV